MQQRVEIIKMLYRDNEILIFDEPTAVLTPQEIEELMAIMRQLISEGKSIIFITHKLKEIKMVADRCTILRKGKHVATVDVADTSVEEMSELMVGRKVDLTFDLGKPKLGKTVLKVRNLTIHKEGHGHQTLDDVSFDLREGEVLCIGGIEGNGQSELVYAITGLLRDYQGQIFLNDKEITNSNIRFRNVNGIAHIPEDRHRYGLVLDYTLEQNLIMQSYFEPEFQHRGLIRFGQIANYADKLIEQYDIRTGQGRNTLARSMSGGNQQKRLLPARWSADIMS